LKSIPYLCLNKQTLEIMKKISQYNWNWWFASSSLVILIGMMIGMVAQKESELAVASGIMIVGLVSLIPCLYIGCKPSEN